MRSALVADDQHNALRALTAAWAGGRHAASQGESPWVGGCSAVLRVAQARPVIAGGCVAVTLDQSPGHRFGRCAASGSPSAAETIERFLPLAKKTVFSSSKTSPRCASDHEPAAGFSRSSRSTQATRGSGEHPYAQGAAAARGCFRGANRRSGRLAAWPVERQGAISRCGASAATIVLRAQVASLERRDGSALPATSRIRLYGASRTRRRCQSTTADGREQQKIRSYRAGKP